MFEMNKNPSVVLVVFLYSMIQLLYLRLCQETQDVFFQLSASLTWNNLYQRNPILHSFLNDPVEFCVNPRTIVVGIMQVQFDLRHIAFLTRP